MLLPIVRYNQPVLRKKGAQVTAFDAALRTLADDMVETMHEAEGIGLAAQQIGQAIQFCVVDLRPTDAEFTWELDGRKPPLDLFMPLAIANPKITVLPGKETSYEEGCLSFPGGYQPLARPDTATCTGLDPWGNEVTVTGDGTLARCLQHETDHLNGIVFGDRLSSRSYRHLEQQKNDLAHLYPEDWPVTPKKKFADED